MNNEFKLKFDIPFIFAVKGSNKNIIIEEFKRRLLNDDVNKEFEDALNSFSYEYDAWTNIRDLIVEYVEERVQQEYKTKVTMVSGHMAKDNTRGGD